MKSDVDFCSREGCVLSNGLRLCLRGVALVFLTVLSAFDASLYAKTTPLPEPLPIDVALSVRQHDGRSTFAFSPDGNWIAHTIQMTDELPLGSRFYSPDGVPLAEGRSRREAHLTVTRTGEEIRLGSATSSSWAPTWSPDGRLVAFYSDEGGSAGLWIWNVATRRATRVPGVTVRPFFGFESPRWSGDGHAVLCKILPENVTIAQANALNPLPGHERRFSDDKDVLVLRSARNGPPASADARSFTDRSLADLAVIDIQTGHVQPIARDEKILWYGFSPDQRYLAYTRIVSDDPNSQEIFYDVVLVERRSGGVRSLAQNVPMSYGTELNWSPNSNALAVVEHDKKGVVDIAVLPIDGSPPRHLVATPADPIKEIAPHWTMDGCSLFAVTQGGRLWRVDVLSGASLAIQAPAGVKIEAVVARFDQPVVWTTGNAHFLWALGLRAEEHQYSLVQINAASGRALVKTHLSGEIDYGQKQGADPGQNLDASDARAGIAFVASDQLHPADLWIYRSGDSHPRRISRWNADLERYQLGDAKVIGFHTANGRELHASLLLPPPAYRAGELLPTVVWVYGGEKADHAVEGVDAPCCLLGLLQLAQQALRAL